MGIDPGSSRSSLPPEKVDDLAKRLNDPRQAEEAASEWFNMMFATLHSIARRGINQRLQGRYDPEDITQAAFDSFFKRRAQYADKSTEELKRILVTIAFCKSRGRARSETAECRDPRLEEGGSHVVLEQGAKLPSPEEPVRLAESGKDKLNALCLAIKNGEMPDMPTMLALLKLDVQPEQAVVLEELFLLVPEDLLHVFLLMIANHTEDEMAEILNFSRRTITRKKSKIRNALLAELKDFGFLKLFDEESDLESEPE
jgi:DNA-directed RNA polymerase specialized sigma24 family protein